MSTSFTIEKNAHYLLQQGLARLRDALEPLSDEYGLMRK